MEEDYISVEEMWSEVKKQAIADDIQDFWVVFKVQKDLTNADDLKKPCLLYTSPSPRDRG